MNAPGLAIRAKALASLGEPELSEKDELHLKPRRLTHQSSVMRMNGNSDSCATLFYFVTRSLAAVRPQFATLRSLESALLDVCRSFLGIAKFGQISAKLAEQRQAEPEHLVDGHSDAFRHGASLFL